MGGGAGGVEFWRAEAERLAADNLVWRGRVAELEGQVGALTEKVSTLARLAFGTSSEKAAAKPTPGEDDPAGGQAGGQEKRGRGQRRGSRGHSRRDYSHLPTREEIHDVAEADQVLPALRRGLCPVQAGVLRADQLAGPTDPHRAPAPDLPAWLPVCGPRGAGRPTGAKAIAKGRFTSGFVARLLCEKFVLGRPAHRIVATLAHDGLHLAEGTLAGVFAVCSDLLAPLAGAISDLNAAAAHLHVDETSWNVYAVLEGKDSHRWWCWVFIGPDTTVFRIAPSRSLAVLAEQLGIDTTAETLPEDRSLLLSSDFYTVYQSLGRLERVDNLWCWAHIQRYFLRADDAHPELAAWTAGWVERIKALYVAHTAMAAASPGSSAHTWAAAQFSAALNTIDTDRKTQAAHPGLLHPAAVKVLATLGREWEGLARPAGGHGGWQQHAGDPVHLSGPGQPHCVAFCAQHDPVLGSVGVRQHRRGAPPPGEDFGDLTTGLDGDRQGRHIMVPAQLDLDLVPVRSHRPAPLLVAGPTGSPLRGTRCIGAGRGWFPGRGVVPVRWVRTQTVRGMPSPGAQDRQSDQL
jgi:transposase